jgi:nucleoside-diphosphate-sugar epimerase
MAKERILIIGALGQIGSELLYELSTIYGADNVIASDIVEPRNLHDIPVKYEHLNALDKEKLRILIDKYQITQIYLMAAILSARAETNPLFAWRLNMEGLHNVVEVAYNKGIRKMFWPSSIAVFGPNTPRQNTPQHTVMDPNTAYGISKQAGERWVEYYWKTKGMDIRSLRYPGIISYKTQPGGGTTDYAVDIYFKAKAGLNYSSFLKEDTYLPMMYMPDAIRATLELMEAPLDKLSIHSAYNVSSMSFCPADVAKEIQKHKKDFEVSYKPDFRQAIADSWPASIDDSVARNEWGWKPEFDLAKMTTHMLEHIQL